MSSPLVAVWWWLLLSASLLARVALGQYQNQPIADITNNSEINTNGVEITRWGNTFKVPRERGFCADNALCVSTTSTPSPLSTGLVNEGCYSKFYFPNAYDFPNCNRGFQSLFPPSDGSPFDPNVNLTGAGNFNTYNISYETRLFLMDLDLNGWGNITNNGQDQQCVDNFTKFCYVVMWIHNIRAGFGCRQNVDREGFQLFLGQTYFPPCRAFCYNLVLFGCGAFTGAVLRGGESAGQFCELAPTTNCINAAPSLRPIPVWTLLAPIALVLTRLLSQ